jgi:hypothetical protein
MSLRLPGEHYAAPRFLLAVTANTLIVQHRLHEDRVAQRVGAVRRRLDGGRSPPECQGPARRWRGGGTGLVATDAQGGSPLPEALLHRPAVQPLLPDWRGALLPEEIALVHLWRGNKLRALGQKAPFFQPLLCFWPEAVHFIAYVPG